MVDVVCNVAFVFAEIFRFGWLARMSASQEEAWREWAPSSPNKQRAGAREGILMQLVRTHNRTRNINQASHFRLLAL